MLTRPQLDVLLSPIDELDIKVGSRNALKGQYAFVAEVLSDDIHGMLRRVQVGRKTVEDFSAAIAPVSLELEHLKKLGVDVGYTWLGDVRGLDREEFILRRQEEIADILVEEKIATQKDVDACFESRSRIEVSAEQAKSLMTPLEALPVGSRLRNILSINGLYYVGQIAACREDDIRGMGKEGLQKLDGLLEEVGVERGSLVRLRPTFYVAAQLHLRDIVAQSSSLSEYNRGVQEKVKVQMAGVLNDALIVRHS